MVGSMQRQQENNENRQQNFRVLKLADSYDPRHIKHRHQLEKREREQQASSSDLLFFSRLHQVRSGGNSSLIRSAECLSVTNNAITTKKQPAIKPPWLKHQTKHFYQADQPPIDNQVAGYTGHIKTRCPKTDEVIIGRPLGRKIYNTQERLSGYANPLEEKLPSCMVDDANKRGIDINVRHEKNGQLENAIHRQHHRNLFTGVGDVISWNGDIQSEYNAHRTFLNMRHDNQINKDLSMSKEKRKQKEQVHERLVHNRFHQIVQHSYDDYFSDLEAKRQLAIERSKQAQKELEAQKQRCNSKALADEMEPKTRFVQSYLNDSRKKLVLPTMPDSLQGEMVNSWNKQIESKAQHSIEELNKDKQLQHELSKIKQQLDKQIFHDLRKQKNRAIEYQRDNILLSQRKKKKPL